MTSATRVFRVAIALFLSGFFVFRTPSPAYAAISCTTTSPGYVTKAITYSWSPPPLPGVSVTGQLWMQTCTDGLGNSVKWRALSSAVGPPYNGPYTVSSVKLASDSGDDCGTWDRFGPATLFNLASQTHWAGWHWQPAVTCGFGPPFNTHNHASGNLTKNGVFSWDWAVNWPSP